ncbi:hypothetical protein [Lentzea sp.]|uniref:DUF2017 family protein n=1 Tax=Lentzea sp. TaxID=56099 RepID=UPI002ED0A72A
MGYFEEFEVDILRGYAESLLRLLEHRADSYGTVQGQRVPVKATADPRLLALLRAELGQDEPAWTLAFHEIACFTEISRLLREQLATLPPTGGAVRFRTESVSAWLRMIRWYVAAINSISDDEGRATGKLARPTLDWFTGIAAGLEALPEILEPVTKTARRS